MKTHYIFCSFSVFLAQQCALISGSVSGGETSTTRSSEILRSQQSTSRLDDLLLMSKNTPSLHTALEIGQSAEHYDLEGQQDVAFDKYQTALGLLIPLLPLIELQGALVGIMSFLLAIEAKCMQSSHLERWIFRDYRIEFLFCYFLVLAIS